MQRDHKDFDIVRYHTRQHVHGTESAIQDHGAIVTELTG
jgi:hypothetical protein